MKKIIPIALTVAVFGLIGCAAKDKASTTPSGYNVATVEQASKCTKCKAKKAHLGKFGVEKNEQDFVK